MKKRITSVILVALLLLIQIPFAASAATSVSYKYSGTNTGRAADTMIIYTYSGSTTGTNTYGYEVVVTDSVVTALGGNNNYIPYNGYVVSGHGTAADWLQSNVTLGMKVSYTQYNSTITFTVDESTYKYAVDAARQKAVDAKKTAVDACLVYDENADVRFSAAETRYNAIGGTVSEAVANQLVAEYENVALLYRERSASEYRGVWHRPTQRSAAEVEAFVRDCYQKGINMISVEALYDCTTIYPVPSGSYFSQNPYFNGFDVLGAFSKSCRRYGIELHCWMPVFYSGHTDSANWSLSVVAKKPEWALTTNNGKTLYSDEASGMVFLNPAIPEVQDFLAQTYEYLLKTYQLDGFQLDYIRYRDRTANEDYGYDATTIARFKEAYSQYRSYTIKYDQGAIYWDMWVNFRASLIGDFVQKMRLLVDRVAPNVVLSADVGPDPNYSYSTYYQNSTYWLTQGWLDIIHPMAYGSGYESMMQKFYTYIESGCVVVPGLGIFMDEFGAEEMVAQTVSMTDVGCPGVVYFEIVAFNQKNCGERLTETLFTEWAVAPSFNCANTVVANVQRYLQRLDMAYDAGKIDWQTHNDLTWVANQAINAAKTESASAAQIWTDDLYNSTINRVSSGALRDRLLCDAKNANEAALLDNGIDVYEELEKIDDSIPPEAVGVAQLTIDKINGEHLGEDSVLITDPSQISKYNLKFAYVMLLKPVGFIENVYEIVEARQNTGSVPNFKTALTAGMVVASFHTDNTGSGLARRDLAKSLKIGSHVVLYGIDVEACGFTSLNPMLYVYSGTVTPPVVEPDMNCDINGDGEVDMFDYAIVKKVYFELPSFSLSTYPRADVDGDGEVTPFDYLLVKTAYFNS